MARNYSSTANEPSLGGGIDGSATTANVPGAVGWPANTPFTAVLDPDTSSEEIVTVTNRAGPTWTIVRAQDGSAALPHSTGAKVRHMMTARDLRESQEHIDASTGVHGVTSGNVVGTSQAQTLTNKAISGTTNTLTNIAQSSVTGLTAALAAKDTALANHEADTTTHGATGAIVGTTNAQTLTNKTVDAGSNTITGIPIGSLTPELEAKVRKTDRITDIACGVVGSPGISFNSSGNGTLTHNAGFVPTVIMVQALLTSGIVYVSFRNGGTLNSTAASLRATTTSGVYEGSVTDLFWIAIRSA